MTQALLTVVIPSRNEKYLQKTIKDLLDKAVEKIEIIAILDGYWPPISEFLRDSRITYIRFPVARGMRAAINAAYRVAKGEYIMKLDAHCMVLDGFDVALKADCEDNWVVVPRRYSLDVENWKIKVKPPVDYMYLAHPDDPSVWGGKSLQGKEWRGKNINEKGGDIIDLMTAQGSCWFMKKEYFKYLELMDEVNYGEFSKEMQEIGLKCWLSGGRMVRNRKTWYAHWHKPKDHGRGYPLKSSEFKKGADYAIKWMNGKVWHKQEYDIRWLIDKFAPVPGWPNHKI